MPTTEKLPIAPMAGVRTRFPIATTIALLTWAVCTALYHLGAEGLFLAVRRDPRALADGQWWRAISPVLMQPDSVPVVIGLGMSVALVGIAGERVLGTWRWCLLFVAGALAGEAVGEVWQPYSAGISVGGCGVLGGLVAYVLITRRAEKQLLVVSAVVVVGAVVLSVITDIHGPAVLAGVLVGAVLVLVSRSRS
jgi:rhomboid protease GluP